MKVILTKQIVTIRGVSAPEHAGGGAVAFPENASRRSAKDRLVKRVSIDDDGTFIIHSLAPGETYLVTAHSWGHPVMGEAYFAELSRIAVRMVAERPGIYDVDLRKH